MRYSGCDFWMKKAAVETHLLDKINRSGEGRNGQRNATDNTNERPWLDWMMVEVPRDGWGRLVDGDAPRGGQYWSCRWCRRFDDKNLRNNRVVQPPWHHPWVTPPKTAALIHAKCSSPCISAGNLRGNHYSLIN